MSKQKKTALEEQIAEMKEQIEQQNIEAEDAQEALEIQLEQLQGALGDMEVSDDDDVHPGDDGDDYGNFKHPEVLDLILFQFFHALFRYSFAHNMYAAFYLIAVGWLDTWYVTLFLWFAVEVFYNDCVLHPLSLHPGGEYGNTLGSWVEHIFWQFVMLVIVFTAIPVFEAILVFLGPCFDSVARMYGAVCIFLMAGKWILDSVVWWLSVLVPVLSLPVGSFMGTYKVFSFFTDTASKSSGWSDGWFPRGSDDFGAYTEAWKSLMQIVRGCVWLHKVYTWCTGGPVVWGFQLLAAISGWWNRPT